MNKGKVLILMGSDSDFPIVKKTLVTLKSFDIEYDVKVLSAHRTPLEAKDQAANAIENGFNCIIAAAGKAAHLPGVLAAFTTLPVIGLPIKSSTMDGLDSLLSIVQMPSGIPVATVAINGSENAGILAAQILALKYEYIAKKLVEYKISMKENVLKKNESIQEEVSKI